MLCMLFVKVKNNKSYTTLKIHIEKSYVKVYYALVPGCIICSLEIDFNGEQFFFSWFGVCWTRKSQKKISKNVGRGGSETTMKMHFDAKIRTLFSDYAFSHWTVRTMSIFATSRLICTWFAVLILYTQLLGGSCIISKKVQFRLQTPSKSIYNWQIFPNFTLKCTKALCPKVY